MKNIGLDNLPRTAVKRDLSFLRICVIIDGESFYLEYIFPLLDPEHLQIGGLVADSWRH